MNDGEVYFASDDEVYFVSDDAGVKFIIFFIINV